MPIPDLWLSHLTIGQALRAVAAREPDREAFVFCDRGLRLAYAEYDSRVDAVAKGLMALGVDRGDHVAIWATNWPEWLLLHLGTARIGAVLVTINPAYRARELAYTLEQSDATLLFAIDRFKTSDYFGMVADVCPELAHAGGGPLRSARFPKLRGVVALPPTPAAGMSTWAEMLQLSHAVDDEQLRAREATLAPDEPINLQYTSGTTGTPKGVLLSHRNLLLNAYYVGECQRLSDHDRVCVPVPFYHCFGCVIGILGTLVRGATLLSPSEYFDPTRTLDCVERERATSVYGVPTMFIAQLEDPSFSGRDLSSLRTGIMAGSPCPVELMKRVIRDMGAREMTIAYGQTEASPAITQTRTDDPLELRVSTVGRPIPGVEVRVVDPETLSTTPDGLQGELWARGHDVMIGYYKMAEATAETVTADGWLRTGDLAVQQPNGYIRITGRIKDLIIRGGENIYPREIEEVLFGHPKIEAAQVVGIPDERLGEEVCAWIKLRAGSSATAEEMRDFCRSSLSHFKVPRYIEFVDAFPMTVTGKVQKFRIREREMETLGIDALPTSRPGRT